MHLTGLYTTSVFCLGLQVGEDGGGEVSDLHVRLRVTRLLPHEGGGERPRDRSQG